MARSTLQRILIVEDDPDIQMIAKFALETVGGFNVEACHEGRYAIESSIAFSPDLILLDVMMPEMDGPQVLKALRTDTRTFRIPVIFMTAKAQMEEIAQLKQMGVVDVISKPFDPMTLSDRIQSIWKKTHD